MIGNIGVSEASAKPDVDEYGEAEVDHGRLSDTSIEECVGWTAIRGTHR